MLSRFLSKSSALKSNVIRSTLLPFLSRYREHPSNKTLRPEDLDRRVSILNKWWTGLLEMLNGQNQQSISGTDRPVFLDAVAGIMIRPEWRLTPSAIDQSTRRPPQSRSTTSLSSNASEFLAESVYHNVRNTFVQNLLSQMAFVVDKMSLRNAPASLVSFCGKAAAYAFFFCPGVAEILVRLWDTRLDTFKRVLAAYEHQRSNPEDVERQFLSSFPSCLHPLAFTTLPRMIKSLRRCPPFPLGAAHINWYGNWRNRWSGKDSDLFFVFAKHFHILVCECLQEGVSKQERLLVPGMLSVHAQILSILDTTIHRPKGQARIEINNGPSSVTFDDVLQSADASATALPLPPTNTNRSVAENRLIMLLRDLMADKSSAMVPVRQVFVQSFVDLLQGTARRTSLFDNNACYALCDFMEEVTSILSRYGCEMIAPEPLLDWGFWFDVGRQMLLSNNNMTEIRFFAFLYSTWNIITNDERRREDLCLGLLLDRSVFATYFKHWSPMIRAYFHRLLCWRLARCDGDASTLDV